jgi:hypothetical protein
MKKVESTTTDTTKSVKNIAGCLFEVTATRIDLANKKTKVQQ